MSTVKTDAITAVSTNGDLSLDGLGTGGVSIASTLKMTKGGDISSASPLVIDVDGNYFDVTGTTNFSAMTVESGNFFMLQFDGALTITHGSGIELPGAANLTTAAGDRLICYATAANTVEVMSVETEAAAAGGGGFVFVSTSSLSGASSVAFTGLTTGVDYQVVFDHMDASADSVEVQLQYGTGGSPTYQTSGYEWYHNNNQGNTSNSTSDAEIEVIGNIVNGGATAGEYFSLILTMLDPGADRITFTQGFGGGSGDGGEPNTMLVHGHRQTADIITAFQFTFSGGTYSGEASLFKRTNV